MRQGGGNKQGGSERYEIQKGNVVRVWLRGMEERKGG
jgi:hypothetical protein